MAEEKSINNLRRRAEALAAESNAELGEKFSAEKEALLHELEVHHVELQLQNEELRAAQQEIQASRNRYADLFEFAPVGYFILNRYFIIENANLTGARILGIERGLLSGMRFMSFVKHSDQESLYKILSSHADGDGRRCEATMRRPDGTLISAELKISERAEADIEYRIALVDITERKRMEEEVRTSRDKMSATVFSLNERSEQLRHAAAELTFAEQRERQRIAGVLHDSLQQVLVGAKYRLAIISRGQDTSDLSELLDNAIEISRSLTAELSPPVLAKGGLVSSLQWLANWMRDKHGLDVTLAVCRNTAPLSEDLLLMLFHATRELLFNVVKHAKIKAARIKIDAEGGGKSLLLSRMTGQDSIRAGFAQKEVHQAA